MRVTPGRWPVEGPIGPADDGVDGEFWVRLAHGELVIQQCQRCKSWLWPAQWRCPRCPSEDVSWTPVAASGVVYSWIRTWQPFSAAFAEFVPYTTLLVELPHAGCRRLLGLLVDGGDADPRIGEAVHGVVQEPCDATGGVPVLRWVRAEP